VKQSPFFKKTLRILLTSALFALWFVLVSVFLSWLGVHSSLLAFFLVLIPGLYYYEEITRFIRNFVDRNFYQELYRISTSFQQFNRELNATLEYPVLIQKFKKFLQENFSDHAWAFYLCWGRDYELMAYHPADLPLPSLIKVENKKGFLNLFKENVNFYPLHKLRGQHPLIDELLSTLQEGRFYYFFPMISFKGHIGFLLFDSSLNRYIYFHSIRELFIRVFQKTSDIMENAQLYSEVKRKSLQDRLLLEVGKKISASLKLDEVLNAIMDSISQLVSFDAGGIFLIDRHRKELRRVVTRGYDPKLLDKIHLKLNKGIYGKVIATKKPSIINDVSRSPEYCSVRPSTRSQLTVPLLYGNQVMGVIAVESDLLNHFTPADLELLETFASQAVIAIANAQLFEEAVMKKRLESELLIASRVQKALLPERPPRFEGFQISTVNIPARIVGGDFFDVFRTSQNMLGLAIGDVSGKGAPASILMAMLYAGFKSLLKEIYPVVEIVARLNNLLTETTAEGYYATFFFGVIDRHTRRFTFTNAGHNPPLLVRKDLSVRQLDTGGIVLGFLPDQQYRQETVELKSGDYLILYTDGVTEVKNKRDQEFGEQRLVNLIKKHYGTPPHQLKELILEAIRRFSARKELSDDVTMILLYVE